jgi:hypothetical protein
MKQIIKPGYLLTLALFTLASVPASAHHEGSEPGLALYDPFQVRVLNLSMDPTDWETIKADTTYTIEVHASLWEGVDLSATNMVSVSVRRKSVAWGSLSPGRSHLERGQEAQPGKRR